MNPRHVTAAMAIAYVHFVTNGKTTLTVGQIRVWAHRDHVHRVGTDPHGYALYDLNHIITRVSLPNESQTCNLSGGDLRPDTETG